MKKNQPLFSLFCFVALLCFACNNGDDMSPENPVDCLGEATGPNPNQFCADLNPSFSNCILESVGTFKLETESKESFPQYCKEVGDTIFYRNAVGDRIKLVVAFKDFSNYAVMFNSDVVCENDNSKTIGYCYDIQTAVLNLKSTNPDLDFLIALDIAPTIGAVVKDEIGDRLSVLVNQGLGYVFALYFVASQRTLPSNETSIQVFDENLELLGTNYENVYSPSFYTTYKFYYTREQGLIGFIDLEGELWVLEN